MWPPGGAAIWKNGSVRIATSSPVSVPKTPGSSSAAETSIETIVRVRVGRAHEVHVAHAVALDVVDEDALPLRRAGRSSLRGTLCPTTRPSVRVAGLGLDRGHRAPPSPAATTASTMFQ